MDYWLLTESNATDRLSENDIKNYFFGKWRKWSTRTPETRGNVQVFRDDGGLNGDCDAIGISVKTATNNFSTKCVVFYLSSINDENVEDIIRQNSNLYAHIVIDPILLLYSQYTCTRIPLEEFIKRMAEHLTPGNPSSMDCMSLQEIAALPNDTFPLLKYV